MNQSQTGGFKAFGPAFYKAMMLRLACGSFSLRICHFPPNSCIVAINNPNFIFIYSLFSKNTNIPVPSYTSYTICIPNRIF